MNPRAGHATRRHAQRGILAAVVLLGCGAHALDEQSLRAAAVGCYHATLVDSLGADARVVAHWFGTFELASESLSC